MDPGPEVSIEKASVAFRLPPLPYAYDALEPYLSADTLRLHHDVLHRRYVDNLNRLLGNVAWSLEWIIQHSPPGELLNNALQAWNHDFLWRSMRPPNTGVRRGLPGFEPERYADGFVERAKGIFGAGYLWLLREPYTGRVVSWTSSNGDNPIRSMPGYRPLLTVDVWEHAYLLDHGAERGAYARDFIEHLANWDFAWLNFTSG